MRIHIDHTGFAVRVGGFGVLWNRYVRTLIWFAPKVYRMTNQHGTYILRRDQPVQRVK